MKVGWDFCIDPKGKRGVRSRRGGEPREWLWLSRHRGEKRSWGRWMEREGGQNVQGPRSQEREAAPSSRRHAGGDGRWKEQGVGARKSLWKKGWVWRLIRSEKATGLKASKKTGRIWAHG